MGAQGNPGDGAGLIRAFIKRTLRTSWQFASPSVFSGNVFCIIKVYECLNYVHCLVCELQSLIFKGQVDDR